jgi:hypothetical protein
LLTFGSGDGGGQDSAKLSLKIRAVSASPTVAIDFAKTGRIATVTFNVTTGFYPDTDDAEEHNGIDDLTFSLKAYGATVVDVTISAPGLYYDASSNFNAHATGDNVLGPTTYVITGQFVFTSRGVKHPSLSGSVTTTRERIF